MHTRAESLDLYKLWCKVLPKLPNQPTKRGYIIKLQALIDTLKKYNLSLFDYNELLARQCGNCALCREAPPGYRRLAIDHDHSTGKVRGLLCTKCNTQLPLVEKLVRLHGRQAYVIFDDYLKGGK